MGAIGNDWFFFQLGSQTSIIAYRASHNNTKMNVEAWEQIDIYLIA